MSIKLAEYDINAAMREINENNLYSTDAEKQAILADKEEVVEAFLFNFFGILGLLNSAKTPRLVNLIKQYAKQDKKLRITTIDDDNNDMSLSLKLAHEAGMFKTTSTVNDITKFLVKMRQGEIAQVDSTFVANWANDLKPEFAANIRNAKIKGIFKEFAKDGGKTIDISRLAMALKLYANKLKYHGDFMILAKGKPMQDISGIAGNTANATPTVADTPQTDTKTDVAANIDDTVKKALATAVPVPDPVVTPVVQKEPLTDYAIDAIIRGATSTIMNYTSDQTNVAKVREWSENYQLTHDVLTNDKFDKVEMDLIIEAVINFANAFNDIIVALNKKDFDVTGDTLKGLYEKYEETRSTNIPKLTDNGEWTSLLETNIVYSNVSMTYTLSRVFDSFKRAFDGETLSDADMSTIVESEAIEYNTAKTFLTKVIETESYKDIVSRLFNPMRAFSRSGGNSREIVMILEHVVAGGASRVKSILDKDIAPGYSDNYPKYLGGLARFPWRLGTLHDVTANEVFRKIYPDLVSHIIEVAKHDKGVWAELAIPIMAASGRSGPRTNGITFDDNDVNGYDDSKLVTFIKETLIKDFELNGISNSDYNNVVKDIYNSYLYASNKGLAQMIDALGLKLEDLVNKHPKYYETDAKLTEMAIRSGNIEIEQAAFDLLLERSMSKFKDMRMRYSAESYQSHAFKQVNTLIANAEDYKKAIKALDFYVTKHGMDGFDDEEFFATFLELASGYEGDSVVEFVKFARRHNMTKFFDDTIYKNEYKRDKKAAFVATLTGVIFDTMGTEVEPYMAEILEKMTPNVTNRIRGSLVGISAIKDEFDKSEINMFTKIDDKRIKEILLYNDIKLENLTQGRTPRKKKGEGMLDYIKRAKATVDSQVGNNGGILGAVKVSPDDKTNKKAFNKQLIENNHAGKHGDIYPKITKMFNVHMESPEFLEFRNNAPGGKDTVTPAFHGSGGVASSMILRYGYTVVKSSDSSVVGRMLGDGIYFSNKIDKVSQYISNHGYSRHVGAKGYIFDIDVNLGKRPKDFDSAGEPNGRWAHIRSPEWCVRNPKAQINIMKVYEVELQNKRGMRDIMEGNEGIKGFKTYLAEARQDKMANQAVFIFRDGLIPFEGDDGTIEYIDFEDAIKDGYIRKNQIEVNQQGPMLIFDGVNVGETYDLRFATQLKTNHLSKFLDLCRDNNIGIK